MVVVGGSASRDVSRTINEGGLPGFPPVASCEHSDGGLDTHLRVKFAGAVTSLNRLWDFNFGRRHR